MVTQIAKSNKKTSKTNNTKKLQKNKIIFKQTNLGKLKNKAIFVRKRLKI